MLMKPLIGRHYHAAWFPVDADHFAVVGPEQGIALTAEDDDVRTRPMAMGFFVAADREFRDMRAHDVAGQFEIHVSATAAALFPIIQLDFTNVGHEVDFQFAAPEFSFAAEELLF